MLAQRFHPRAHELQLLAQDGTLYLAGLLIADQSHVQRRAAIAIHSLEHGLEDQPQQLIQLTIDKAGASLGCYHCFGQRDLLLHHLQPGGMQLVEVFGHLRCKWVRFQLCSGVRALLQQLNQGHGIAECSHRN